MARTIYCTKLHKETEGLDFAPYPGELGKRIYQHISKEAWQMWINRQLMFINEYRLNMLEPKARDFLAEEMEKFLFSDESQAPAGYKPPEENKS